MLKLVTASGAIPSCRHIESRAMCNPKRALCVSAAVAVARRPALACTGSRCFPRTMVQDNGWRAKKGAKKRRLCDL